MMSKTQNIKIFQYNDIIQRNLFYNFFNISSNLIKSFEYFNDYDANNYIICYIYVRLKYGFWYYQPVFHIYDFKYYINNRFITRTNSLTAHKRDIKPGSWCDIGNRFLPCLFNELVDFVEIEQAWHCVMWDEEAMKKHRVPWYRRGWLRWRSFQTV